VQDGQRSAEVGSDRLTVRGVPVDPNLRVLAIATLVNTIGNGALMTTFALYFTQVVELSAAEVGGAISIAALAGMLSQVPLGHLGDVRGPRELLRWLTLGAGISTLGLLFTEHIAVLAAVLAVESVFDRGGSAVRSGIIARIAEGPRGVSFRAYLRSITNVGISLGAGLGGLALLIDARWAFLAIFVLNAVSFAVAALLLGRLPHLDPAPPRVEGESRLQVLRDTPYVIAALLTGVFAMHFTVMELAMPIWIAAHTAAPDALVAVTLLCNTVAVALFQVRLSRGSDSVRSSARTLVVGGAWVMGGFALIALASGRPAWLAVVLLLGGALVHVVGEMIGSGGQWGVQMGLAPRERQGQYQGFAGTSWSLASIAAPPLAALLCIQWGKPGWIVMGAIVLGSAIVNVPVTHWALRTRARYGVHTHTG
jgi:MFS family permease